MLSSAPGVREEIKSGVGGLHVVELMILLVASSFPTISLCSNESFKLQGRQSGSSSDTGGINGREDCKNAKWDFRILGCGPAPCCPNSSVNAFSSPCFWVNYKQVNGHRHQGVRFQFPCMQGPSKKLVGILKQWSGLVLLENRPGTRFPFGAFCSEDFLMNLSYKAEERDRQIHERTGGRKFSIKFAYNLLEGDYCSNSRYKWRADSIANFLCDCSGIILGMFPALVRVFSVMSSLKPIFFADHLAVLGVARNADLYPRFDSDDCFNIVPVLLQGRYCCFIGVGSTLWASLASFGCSSEVDMGSSDTLRNGLEFTGFKH
ncbi:hypothetical protein D5086_032185 [Populus alba]|uniref:Uncharacterized protein n=1 Tax=Populus alba TaxID=43335 RepID=A0ACC4AKN7_POPAL